MYLFVHADRTATQFSENLSVTDLIAVVQGLLDIYRVSSPRKRFQRLVVEGGRAIWKDVPPGVTVTSKDGRVHF